MDTNRPFLVIPKLIEQPTWGGTYIPTMKGWADVPGIKGKKIGQSYELSGSSLLALSCTNSQDSEFANLACSTETSGNQTISIQSLIDSSSIESIGVEKTHMPLLIKFTQALGNSFQLHRKNSQRHARWKPKAESWYFMENGYITLGLNPKIETEEFKSACKTIESKVKALSSDVLSGAIALSAARQQAKEFCVKVNPWQFVNSFAVHKGRFVDLSLGGIHHSWEENAINAPLGNIVYEVQQDVSDDDSTIRCFDQGKILSDGTVRPIAIDDYFTFLDTEPEHNTLPVTQSANELHTPLYSIRVVTLTSQSTFDTHNSFLHLFVQRGGCTVQAGKGELHLTTGHSAFVPAQCQQVLLSTTNEKSDIIITSFPNL